MSLAGIINCMSTSHLSTGVIHTFTITALTQQTHGTYGTKTLIDGTLAPKALRVVLRQSGLTINSSPHIANHYMFVFNFITLLLLRYCCHI